MHWLREEHKTCEHFQITPAPPQSTSTKETSISRVSGTHLWNPVVFKNSLTLADWDEFIDDFCEYVDSRGLGLCGFGGQMPLSATEGWIQKRGHGSPTESQRQEVVTWLRNCPEVLAALPGVMIDAWY